MDLVLNKTKSAFLWTWILRAPFWVVYNLLLFILYKDLQATPFQIALFIALKPIVSIFSMYWSSYINKRPDRILGNIIWGGAIGYLPFLFAPFFGGAWYVLFASAVFIMMHRGIVPGWMEVLKLNLPGDSKQKVFSNGSIISYAIGCVLPFFIGPFLDLHPESWRLFVFIFAFLGFITTFIQRKIPITITKLPPSSSLSLKEMIVHPWKKTFDILKTRKDFTLYQIGFMVLGGSGLMIMQPVLPAFFIDVLNLSYTELSVAMSICKGLGFAIFSPLWARLMPKIDIYRFSSFVTFLAALFPLVLLASQFHIFWIYVAYLIYGILQGGSELSWHLSGPIFSKEEDSTPYSTVNVLAVGLRGLAIPQLGSLLVVFIAPASILLIGAVLCVAGGFWMLIGRQKVPSTI